MNTSILPDSRLSNQTYNSKMVDWPMPDGSTIRVEVTPVYCANCGHKFHGGVPKDNTFACFYLCDQCFTTYGGVAGTYAMPDDEFCKAVASEMLDKHGKYLSEQEIVELKDQGKLCKELLLLEKESPWKIWNGK